MNPGPYVATSPVGFHWKNSEQLLFWGRVLRLFLPCFRVLQDPFLFWVTFLHAAEEQLRAGRGKGEAAWNNVLGLSGRLFDICWRLSPMLAILSRAGPLLWCQPPGGMSRDSSHSCSLSAQKRVTEQPLNTFLFAVWERPVLNTVFSQRCAGSRDLVGPLPCARIALVPMVFNQESFCPCPTLLEIFGNVWKWFGLSQLGRREG